MIQEVEAARQAAESAEAEHETAVAEHQQEEALHSHGPHARERDRGREGGKER